MKVKKILALCLAAAMVCGAAGCGNTNEGNPNQANTAQADSAETETGDAGQKASTDEGGTTTINIRIMNDVTNVEKVVDRFYEETKDDPELSKIRLNITYVSGADYADKLTLAITAQEDYDLMFCGGWHGLDGFIQDGTFADVTAYFNNDEYPGLKAAFSEDYVKANSFDGKVYAIPLMESYEDLKGIAYREDLRKKYDCPEVTDLASFETFLKTMKEHLDEEGLLAAWGVTSLQGLTEWLNPSAEAKRHNIMECTAGVPFALAVSEDGKTLKGIATIGDEDSEFADFPEGYQTDYLGRRFEELPYWLENYCNQDVLSSQDDGKTLEAGLYAATYSTLTEWLTKQKDLKTNFPEAELGLYLIDDKQRNFEKEAIVSEMKTWNYLVVPAWSTKVDATMKFLDWMWGTQENHDLFQYGLEGTDWEAIGDNAYKTLEIGEADKYTMPGYSFTWNPTYIRYSSDVLENESIVKLLDYQYEESTYKLAPVTGFTFDDSNVESEVATLSALYSDFKGAWGVYGDETAAKIKQFNEDCKNAGLEKVREELRTQYQSYLDSQQ